ncbi:unnamed protein product [Rotaria sp. Silwood2]|nr:unnamed protein product [Rotaria sp. Silwood2]
MLIKMINFNLNVRVRRIQYAKVHRWQPPVDLAFKLFSNGSFEATSFGPCCPQPDTGIYIPTQDEQCLYLNIFTPKHKSNQSLLPVLVWIHGGGLMTGCSSQSIPLLYNGTNIIRNSLEQPVIIVTINYRLGIFADMYLVELIKENSHWPTAGNYNYLDMLSALHWININIRDYGGNPNNVLLFGESSGEKAVVDIGALKGSSNLYHHIISQSAGLTSSYYSNISSALQISNKIVEQLNCTNPKSELILQCLRNTSINDLIMIYGDGRLQSVIDGYFFSYYPLLAIQHGKYNRNINMIIGTNKYELPVCLVFPDMDSEFAILNLTEILGQNRVSTVINYYQLNNCSSNINDTNRCCDKTNLILDTLFGCSIRHCNPGICPKLSKEEGAGVCFHTAELPLVFGTESYYSSMNPINCTWDDQTRIYSNKIISYWINMAKKGEPSKQWQKYDSSTSKYLQFTPYHEFSMKSWDHDCSIFDQIEQDDLYEMFGNIS